MTSSPSHSGLRILAAGPGITLQDGGRKNFLRFGVTTPPRWTSWPLRPPTLPSKRDATAVEVSLGGIEVMAEGAAVTVAVAGGGFRLALGDRDWTGAFKW